MRKVRYLRVSSKILKKNFYDSVQNNTVSSPESPLASNKILKKAEMCLSSRCEWPAIEFIRAFVAVALPHMNDTISISIYKQ